MSLIQQYFFIIFFLESFIYSETKEYGFILDNLCENYEDYRPIIVTWPNFSLNYTYDNRGIPEFIKPDSKEEYNCFIK